MDYDRFVGLVQHRARMDSRASAEAAIRATFSTLSERLAGGLPDSIGSQLPDEVSRHLQSPGTGESFDLQQFWDRIADRERPATETPDAAFHARAVMSVVDEAVSAGTLEKLQDQLPEEWSPLFDYEAIADPDVS